MLGLFHPTTTNRKLFGSLNINLYKIHLKKEILEIPKLKQRLVVHFVDSITVDSNIIVMI